MRYLFSFFLTSYILCLCSGGVVQAKSLSLYAPPGLQESGLLKYILPRFSLKTGIRFDQGEKNASDISFLSQQGGMAVFTGPKQTWAIRFDPENAAARRFYDWLRSDIGKRTVIAFAPEGKGLFEPVEVREIVQVQTFSSPLIGEGKKVAKRSCRRCHAIDDDKSNTIGSTPSFAALRALGDWEPRFEAFFAANPHPAFTQIEGITEEFSAARPSPIVPMRLTLDEFEALLAFARSVAPADLGAPIQYQ